MCVVVCNTCYTLFGSVCAEEGGEKKNPQKKSCLPAGFYPENAHAL